MKGLLTRGGAWHHCVIVGGGASGVLMAAHLLRGPAKRIRVTIIEQSQMLGCGIAYSTRHPDHLLNTRASQMSAFPDRPDHFEQWLTGKGKQATASCFVDRATYGQYLSGLLEPWRSGPDAERLHCVRGNCVSLSETDAGVIARLADGSVISGDSAVLATGHAVPVDPDPPLRNAWDFSPPLTPDSTILIIGTGLSMVDHVVTLLASGHRGQICCLSRRGLLPHVHASTRPIPFSQEEIPFGAPVSVFLHWLRRQARSAEARGGTWRDVVDGIRPHIATAWRSWDLAARARFLRHAASWWEVHRHKMPPVSAARLEKAKADGQLVIIRGRFERATTLLGGRVSVNITRHGREDETTLPADHVIDCRGIRRDPETHAAPVIRDLLARGAARLDPLRLGLDTTTDAKVIDANGRASRRIRAIGPAARGTLWEITAIPDIREQVFRLSRDLIGTGSGW
ncbi:FAD/NAD(P)-binding protein [Polymorphum gilvum]|uniref:FAD dependent oxidoreductase n=1 Tax=Polymorphum gilvum (strain LMG 25793 / CGMCC 1.9160 / SL003B-26A1) TaxID=991905 RepID=F2J2E6_POLGS|nr:FAD/NAD(P)-binding protein [Polymorphum gilvum]ADZ69842.1 FAD dependent oxidoreductase [Polymorphum gilvum SL003B-26A1]